MSAVQLIAALVLLVIGGTLLLRWLQGRHDEEWQAGVGDTQRRTGKQRQQQLCGHGAASDDVSEDEEADGDGEDAGNGAARVRPRAGAGAAAAGGRLNRNVGGGVRRRGVRATNADAEVDPDDHLDDEYDENGVKLTRLQRKKRAKEREREERRLAQEAAVEAQRQQSDAATLREEAAALREEELKAAEEDALRELRTAKAEADNAEYAKWVSHIGVEERGELGDEARERQARVEVFLLDRAAKVQARARRTKSEKTEAEATLTATEETEEESKEGNVLVLQTAARDLKVSVEELVSTMERLTREGQVDGVFDDRGKYVFIAPEHFPQLAQFIRLRGRVSVQEFTRECNRVIMQS